MKTLRFIGMTLLMVVLATNFTSCSDDDENDSVDISYASLKGTWDMTKCYGWEYNGDGIKEDWTEDIKGEYIFFESTHGNGGYFDGSKTNYFASSLDGNKLILKNSNWLLGKSITITKLTTNELHITATETSSVENYEMKKR